MIEFSHSQLPQPDPEMLTMAGLNAEEIAAAGTQLTQEDLKLNPAVLNPRTAGDIGGPEGAPLIGVVYAAGVPVRVYGLKIGDSGVTNDAIILARDRDALPEPNGKRVSAPSVLAVVSIEGDPGTSRRFGRQQPGAEELGLDLPWVSKCHFSVTRTEEGWEFADNNSKGGTILVRTVQR